MEKNAISYYCGKRLSDKLVEFLFHKSIIKQIGYYPVTDNKTKEVMMYFMIVEGNKLLLKILSAITEYRGKDAIFVKVDIPD